MFQRVRQFWGLMKSIIIGCLWDRERRIRGSLIGARDLSLQARMSSKPGNSDLYGKRRARLEEKSKWLS